MNNPTQSPNDPHTLVLTRLEIEVALGLFDLAVKSGGLAVAANAVVLHQKFQAAKPLVKIDAVLTPEA